ncbi:MAG TPA: ATP-binding protein [Acidimicrobiales bacterium]|nr:ATP-binding protein [Acidimicrobiales bacterium]
MSGSASVLRFAAEFATFLVAVAGAAIVFARPRLLGVERASRFALFAGFVCLAGAAFLHGSLLFEAADLPVLGLRGAGIALLALGTVGWGEDRVGRRVVWLALVLIAMAEVAAAVGVADAVVDATRILGAIGLGAVLVTSAHRSIPARLAVSTAASLLLVVLAVSVALSLVITDNVEKEALRRVDSRSRAEADEIETSVLPTAATNATLVAATLQGSRLALLQALDQDPAPSPALAADIDSFVGANLLRAGNPVLYATSKQALVLFSGISRAGAEALVGSPSVEEALTTQSRTVAVQVADGRAVAVASAAVTAPAPEGRRSVGVLVATTALDDAYFNQRAINDRTVSLAVVDRQQPLAGFGPLPAKASVEAVGRSALASADGTASSVSGGYFLSAGVVRASDGSSVLAVVAATPTTVVDDTRNSLFGTLFLVGLGTALMAFLAAGIVGERIGGGLRRLTVAAEGVQRGDFATRVSVSSEDELGVLGSTLNTMAGSIETLTTELRENRDEEARLRSRLEAVVAGMGEAVVAVDRDGRITTFNGAAEGLFGVPAAGAEGCPVDQVVRVTGEDGTDLSPRLARPAEGRWAEAAVVHRDDGTDVPVALSAGALADAAGGIGGGVWVLRDMRREREAERTKADLLANISHELRTPLVPIKGYAMMLGQGRLPHDEAQAGLAAIGDAADQLERVIARLLEVAGRRADGGRPGGGRPGGEQPPETDGAPAPVQVRQVVDSVVRRWKAREGPRHPLMRRIARELPGLPVDRRRLEESLDELVDNAVKFSPEGSRILVAARLVDASGSDGRAGGPAVEISVDDLGIGIATDELSRIFEDFAQADSTATRSFGGLGLGLSVVRRTVEAYDGELVCETEQGKGSRFSIILPVTPMPDGENT